jgi:hypothetical protein
MASSPNTFADTLNGLFKEVYADKLENLIPEGLKLYKMIDFLPKEKQPGNLYHQPVILGHEHGVTFASSDDDAFNLNAPVAGQIKDAQVRGNPVVLRSVLGYTAASRAAQGGAKAFMDATKFLVANMLRSITKKLEIELIYGQIGYGVVDSIAGNVITIATAEFAPGIWAGAENMPIEIRDVTGATVRGPCNVASVDLVARTVTVDLMPAGVVSTDIIWHKGAFGNEFAGLHKIITNSGTLFNISAAAYSLWAGNTYSAGSDSLSLGKIERAIALAVQKGLDSDVHLMVNPKTWADLLVEQTALRLYDSSYSPAELANGGRAIKFFGQNGLITIEPSIYVKEGYAYLIAPQEFARVGSTDVTFKRPGMEGNFFRELENSAGVELRCFSDMALFCSAPGKQVLISNITNTP